MVLATEADRPEDRRPSRTDGGARGSSMSAKQLARTVVEGRCVSIELVGGSSVRGYLCGMDDFHWMVVTPEGKKHLVHKGSASLVTLEESATYDTEPHHADLEEVVGPFRSWVNRTYFSRGDH